MGLKRIWLMTMVASSLLGCGSFDFGLGGSDTDDGGWTSAGATATASGGATAGGGPWGGNACDAYAANAAACDSTVDEDSLLIYCYATAAETLEISQSCAYAHQVLLQCATNQGCTSGGHEETPVACKQQEAALEEACDEGGSSSSDGSSTGDGTSTGDGSSTGDGTTSGDGSTSSGGTTSGGSDSTG